MRFRQYMDEQSGEEKVHPGAGKIVDAAMRLFLEKGYHKTTVRDIASAAGVTQGLITYHFASKENLARRIYVDIVQNIFQQAALSLSLEQQLSYAEQLYISYVVGWEALDKNEPKLRYLYELITTTEIADVISPALVTLLQKVILQENIEISEKELELATAVLTGTQKMLMKLHYESPERCTCQDIADVMCSNLFYNLGISDRKIAQIFKNSQEYMKKVSFTL